MQRINITLPDELVRDLNRYIPPRERSNFIAKTVKEKLANKNLKKEFIKSLKANYKLYKEETETWDTALADGLD